MSGTGIHRRRLGLESQHRASSAIASRLPPRKGAEMAAEMDRVLQQPLQPITRQHRRDTQHDPARR